MKIMHGVAFIATAVRKVFSSRAALYRRLSVGRERGEFGSVGFARRFAGWQR
jgi:hypothetical protein